MIFDGATGIRVRMPLARIGFFSNEGEPKTSPRSRNNSPSTTLAWKISSPFWNRPIAAITVRRLTNGRFRSQDERSEVPDKHRWFQYTWPVDEFQRIEPA